MSEYKLLDAEERHREHPKTFWTPPKWAIERIRPGDHVKLLFDEEEIGTERMWVQVQGVSPDGKFLGILDNDPCDLKTIKVGDTVHFEKQHICQYYEFSEQKGTWARWKWWFWRRFLDSR